MKIECIVCGKKLKIEEDSHRVKCPKCDTIMRWEDINDMIIVKV